MRRALKRGDRGPRVARLQQALQALGYEVDAADGVFGHATEEAVREFQREQRLRIDGRAGAEVWAMLHEPQLLHRRRLIVVGGGDNLPRIAHDAGVTVEYLRRSNRLRTGQPVYPGQRLFIRSRYVLGGAHRLNDVAGTDFMLRLYGRYVTALGSVRFTVSPHGDVEGTLPPQAVEACWAAGVRPFIVCGAADGAEGNFSAAPFGRRQTRERFVKQVLSLLQTTRARGFFFNFPWWRYGQSRHVVAVINALSPVMKQRKQTLFVGAPGLPPGVKGAMAATDVPYEVMAARTDGVVLWTWGGLRHTEHMVRAALRRVPSWRLMLAVHLGAEIQSGANERTETMSYARGMALALKHRTRPRWDDALGMLAADLPPAAEEGGARRLTMANSNSVVARLRLVERFHMQGVYLSALGDEDRRLWSVFPHWIHVWRHE